MVRQGGSSSDFPVMKHIQVGLAQVSVRCRLQSQMSLRECRFPVHLDCHVWATRSARAEELRVINRSVDEMWEEVVIKEMYSGL